MNESGTNFAECGRRVGSGRKVEGAIGFLVNVRELQLEYERVLHEALLLAVLLYVSETNDMARKGEI